jgi:hypothetical protein
MAGGAEHPHAGNGANMQKGTASRVMVSIRSKVRVDQMAAPVLEIVDYSSCNSDSRPPLWSSG